MRPYIPDFKLAFEHVCIHTGGRGVIDEIEKHLQLNARLIEPSRAALYRWGGVVCACGAGRGGVGWARGCGSRWGAAEVQQGRALGCGFWWEGAPREGVCAKRAEGRLGAGCPAVKPAEQSELRKLHQLV